MLLQDWQHVLIESGSGGMRGRRVHADCERRNRSNQKQSDYVGPPLGFPCHGTDTVSHCCGSGKKNGVLDLQNDAGRLRLITHTRHRSSLPFLAIAGNEASRELSGAKWRTAPTYRPRI